MFYAADANYLVWLLHSPLAKLYFVLFDLKPLIEDGNLQVYMYTVCMHKKEPQESPEHTSEVVKSQHCLSAGPQTPLTQSILWEPTFLHLPWAPPNFLAALATPMYKRQPKVGIVNPLHCKSLLLELSGELYSKLAPSTCPQKLRYEVHTPITQLLENVEHCGGEPEQAANMHMNTLGFTLK